MLPSRITSRILPMLLFLLVIPFSISGCTEDSPRKTGCTLIGCDSVVLFKLPEEIYSMAGEIFVSVCVDGNCQENHYASGKEIPRLVRGSANGEKVRVSAEVRDSQAVIARLAEKRLTLKTLRPNGPECGPTCYQGEVEVPTAR